MSIRPEDIIKITLLLQKLHAINAPKSVISATTFCDGAF